MITEETMRNNHATKLTNNFVDPFAGPNHLVSAIPIIKGIPNNK